MVIGHEMTHGFDDQGRNFDKDGNMNNWWTEEDAAAFKAKTDILVKQFDAIEVLPAKGDQPALFANGALCLGENIADQGGLRVAYTAYHNSLEGKEKPAPIDGFTPEQRFYLAYAQSATRRSHVSPSSTYTRWASGASTPRCATCKTFTMPSRSPTARCTCPSRSA